MGDVRIQEVLDGVRIDWLTADAVPERLHAHARAEVQQLRDMCQKMRALSIECRPQDCRLICSCLNRGQAIRVTRPRLLEALWAFEETMRTRCLP